jgi:hypothetical protein
MIMTSAYTNTTWYVRSSLGVVTVLPRTQSTIDIFGKVPIGITEDRVHVPDEPLREVATAGYATCWLLADDSVQCFGLSMEGDTPPSSQTFQTITAGGLHFCGLDDSGILTCWEDGAGSGDDLSGTSPAVVDAGWDAGLETTCVIDADAAVTCVTAAVDGSADDDIWQPTGRFKDIAADGFICGILDDGTISCKGEPSSCSPPKGVFVDVSTTPEIGCAIPDGNGLVCWGVTAPIGCFPQLPQCETGHPASIVPDAYPCDL